MENIIQISLYLFFQCLSFLLLAADHFEPLYVLSILLSIICLLPTLLFRKNRGGIISLLLFYGLSFFWPPLFYFAPGTWFMLSFQLSGQKFLPGVMLLSCFVTGVPIVYRIILILLSIAGLVIHLFWRKQAEKEAQFLALKDDSWEKEQLLRQKNEELLATQEKVIKLEIAEERNRIARDIHDNVGHLLSSAIIQLGAIHVLNQDEKLQVPLQQLELTVHQGMDNIRQSVHDLHRESLLFNEGLHLLLEEFQFCPVTVEGDLTAALTSIQSQTLLMIIKEALSNVMKHSNATSVTIEQKILPAFYRCRISDNGTMIGKNNQQGIGLLSMQQRLNEIKGQLHTYQSAQGFVVTIILPKNEEEIL